MTNNPQISNAVLLASTLKVAEAIKELGRMGLVARAANLNGKRPTIEIQTNARCHRLIQSGEAVYYSFGREPHFGPYREGQFNLGGCRVVWTEFGH
ncbi:hypothetical protein LH427_09690 [Laribacter hongkongensis]|uniref:hypothetical protein n=1 Tax=Laribacter hongkongensis TaxID=168471 RepID=UPI001EFCAF84|nr:hypothetical protein [Laribacter hongkongensis]MCG8993244.1 hypothetical protein [Laribacter hongkongensis]MCG8997937.1 hypothetical protein [Laribacter hongkongensis]MCG9002352.1 hypothetical protein [Laribacter hongkongensis]MCG9005662.1 hypothetical protein [Laribacter hongkongensis]MCG9008799.1 hypothetical protein [Laribacter hongkongensis]